MILDKYVLINKHPYYNKLLKKLYGEDLDKERYLIPVSLLSKNSHVKINVQCDFCGNKKIISISKYNKNTKNENEKYACCEKCASSKIKKTKLERYNNENYNNKEKSDLTKLERYGDKNYNNRELFKITNLKRYDVEHFNKLTFFKNKIKKTKSEKYNNENYNNSKKRKHTIKKLYNTDCTLKLIDVKKKKRKTIINKLEKKYDINIKSKKGNVVVCSCHKGHDYETTLHMIYNRKKYNVDYCTICNPIGVQYSNKEKQLLEFIKENYSGKIISSDRKILESKEIDILLPDINLAFEFNGNYWHSLKEKGYHFSKSRKALEKGIKLYHIWEEKWDNKNSEIKNIIKKYIKNNIK